MAAPKVLGVVFTPVETARRVISQTNLVKDWVSGASVCDPAAGQGHLLWALWDEAIGQGYEVTPTMLGRLFAWELRGENLEMLLIEARSRGWEPTKEQIKLGDFLSLPPQRFDWILSNPPWISFGDESAQEKERLKPLFTRYIFPKKKKGLLWGASRLDVSSLFTAKALSDHLTTGGMGLFFLPSSLGQVQGAHSDFGEAYLDGQKSRLLCRWDWGTWTPFPGVATQSSVFLIENSQSIQAQSFFTWSNGQWIPRREQAKDDLPPIALPEGVMPRQGLNTGGTNGVYIFDRKPDFEWDIIYPLVTKQSLKDSTPTKWILIPHSPVSGKAMDSLELEKNYPKAWAYLLKQKTTLEGRKGVLMKNLLNRGLWYALWGVGPYTFSSWKVVWEAYGQWEFQSYLKGLWEGKPWICAQSLFGFLSFSTKSQGEKIQVALTSRDITRELLNQGRGGTPSWAQPGTMKGFFTQTSDQSL